jgi:heavy metal sensor kinase
MKWRGSIRARLIILIVAALSLIFLCFGTYLYFGFKGYLIASLRETLTRRAHQIAATIVAEIPGRGLGYVASEVRARYAPELNERLIRITDETGAIIYASGNAGALGARLMPPWPGTNAESAPVAQGEVSPSGARFQVVAVGYRTSGGRYLVEVGGPETEVAHELTRLVWMLALGFPVFLALAAAGGYYIVGRALRPVDEIVRSAEQITGENLSLRLPVSDTGDEVQRLSQALNLMIARLDESFRQTSRFSADASHELRTPLTIMRGEIETLLREDNLTPQQTEQLGNVLEETVRLARIVDGLLLMARLGGGESQAKKEPLDLAALVAEIVEQMAALAQEKSIALEHQLEPSVRVEGDEMRLRRVIVNLLDNAIKYTPERGRIEVRTRAGGDEALLEVRDTGMGIAADALPHVFERFYRAPGTGAVDGTGLGLAMVRSIVEAHGGSVTVESREGAGACFRVWLPLRPAG